MQLGFVSAILRDQPLAAVLQFAAETGYACVELMCWPATDYQVAKPGVCHIDVSRLDASEQDRIRGLCRQTGVQISALGYYPNPLSANLEEADEACRHLRLVINAAALLGVGLVNTFIGRNHRQSVAENWPRFVETWQPLVQHAEEHNVRIAIENCPMYFADEQWPGGLNLATSPHIWRKIFEAIPSPNLGLNLDPSHLVWQQIDPTHAIHAFRDKLFHVHAKDARIDQLSLNEHGILSNPKLWHTPKIPGLGDVNWGEFFGALGDIGYAGPVAVEVEDKSFAGPLDRRQASLIQSYRYLQQYVI